MNIIITSEAQPRSNGRVGCGMADIFLSYRRTDATVFRTEVIVGPLADLAEARDWYGRARELGDPEAGKRLKRLNELFPP